MFTVAYSVMHFLVDGICAFAMFFGSAGASISNKGILIYNFCAFALQFPFGVLMDLALSKRREYRRVQESAVECAILGFIITSIGAICVIYDGVDVAPATDILAVILLGVGNALFHIGGGVGAVREDRLKGHRGSDLGVFVAPGAVGLFLGRLLSEKTVTIIGSRVSVSSFGEMFILVMVAESIVFAILFTIMLSDKNIAYSSGIASVEADQVDISAQYVRDAGIDMLIIAPCVLVVILRSYLGLTVNFSWKQGTGIAFIAVLALALGKAFGGFAARSTGWLFRNRRTTDDVYYGYRFISVVSLCVACSAYLLSDSMVLGLIALFAFNMTMPITLYLLCSRFENYVGTMFGLLTLALFIGYLPVSLHVGSEAPGSLLGALICVISLGLLLVTFRALRIRRVSVDELAEEEVDEVEEEGVEDDDHLD